MGILYFPKEEYDLRYKRARESMAEKDLDALLATNVINYTYLGGVEFQDYCLGRLDHLFSFYQESTIPC